MLPLEDGVASVKVGDTGQLSLKTTDAKKPRSFTVSVAPPPPFGASSGHR